MRRLSIVIPAYNEAESLAGVIQDVQQAARKLDALEIVLVDDGSTDGTGEVMDRFTLADPRVTVRHLGARRGLGRALATGFGAATLDLVAWLPADGQFSVDSILRLIDSLDDADIVTSDVRVDERRRVDRQWRVCLMQGLKATMRLLAGRRLPMFTGLPVMRRRVFEHITLTSATGIINFELVAKARRAGCRVTKATLPIEITHRRAGHSKVANISTTLKHVVDILRLRWACR